MLSKEEVDAEKATMRAIDARPIKKVAEAKQRKRKRLQVCRLTPCAGQASAACAVLRRLTMLLHGDSATHAAVCRPHPL